MMFVPSQFFSPTAFLAASVLALGFSSISTKAAGLTWLLITLSGVSAWASRKRFPLPDTPFGLISAQWWLLACAASLVLMAIPTAYWGGPWPERHPQWRLLISALGIWLLLRHGRISTAPWSHLATGAALSLLLALALVLWRGADFAPTNRIPWVAGLSLLSCTLLALSYQLKAAPLRLRRFWWLASGMTLGTVVLSGVRGSWGLLLVWPVTWIWLERGRDRLWHWTPKRLTLLLVVLFGLIWLGNQAIPERDRPLNRIALLLSESGLGSTSTNPTANSSVGIRIGIYRAGLEQVVSAPSWLGIGHDQHKLALKAHVQAIAPELVKVIGHYHNDALNAWAELGLLGLLGYLSVALGVAALAWSSSQTHHMALCTGFWSVLVMHISTGLSNANFAHNYYPTMLAICVALLLVCGSQQGDRPAEAG
ncbi:MAG: O-antigen ligase domain-containing protein [Actinobacteria bacterium]|nr:O-antigen ligase domain-containing protein [Actinomycetota bacterium]